METSDVTSFNSKTHSSPASLNQLILFTGICPERIKPSSFPSSKPPGKKKQRKQIPKARSSHVMPCTHSLPLLPPNLNSLLAYLPAYLHSLHYARRKRANHAGRTLWSSASMKGWRGHVRDRRFRSTSHSGFAYERNQEIDDEGLRRGEEDEDDDQHRVYEHVLPCSSFAGFVRARKASGKFGKAGKGKQAPCVFQIRTRTWDYCRVGHACLAYQSYHSFNTLLAGLAVACPNHERAYGPGRRGRVGARMLQRGSWLVCATYRR